MDRPVVILDCNGMVFDTMCHAVFSAIEQRDRDRYHPPTLITASPLPDNQPVDMPVFIPKITSIKMGVEVFYDALKFSHLNDMTMVDYVDGKGPRPRFWGRVCDLDHDMPPREIQLS